MTSTADESTAGTGKVVLCRCCGNATATAEQKHWNGRGSFTILTCWTAGCDLRGYTFGEPDYDGVDLSAYRQHEERR